VKRHCRQGGWLALSLGLAACTVAPSPALRQAPTTPPKAAPSGTSPSLAPMKVEPSGPSPSALAPTQAFTLSMPARLGRALPASLVGPAANQRLREAVGLAVAAEGSRLVALADGRIISNNSGSSGTSAGAPLVSDQGGGIVSNHGAGRRLAQAEAERLAAADPRMALWFYLCMVDLLDQHLQAWQATQPRLGQWKRFSVQALRLLPTPVGNDILNGVLSGVEQQLQGQGLAALATEEGGQLRLRMALVAAGQGLDQGKAFVDLSARPQGGSVAFLRLPPALAGALGVAEGRVKVEVGPQALTIDSAEDYLPLAERSPLAQGLGGPGQVMWQIRRQVRFPQPSAELGLMEERWAALSTGPLGEELGGQSLRAFGFHPTQELGLATSNRLRSGPPEALEGLPFTWAYQPEPGPFAEQPVRGAFLLPDGRWEASPGPALQALLPPFPKEGTRGLFPVPDRRSSSSAAPELNATPWPSSIWLAPEAP
jgi:antitoxin component of MazEF toxin-antitoxin module